MNSDILREIADNWFLLAMFTFFLGTIFWAFRPGSRSTHRDAADVPFKYDDTAPADEACKGDCAQCRCGSDFNFGPEGQA